MTSIPNTTFADRVIDFYNSFEKFAWTDGELALVSPVGNERRQAAFEKFCHKFYHDNNDRVFCLGINPSRVRNSSTGVPYTDGFALENTCEIQNDFSKSRELSSIFFNKAVEHFGGAEEFYKSFYPGAVFPLSILSSKKYCNYYDSNVPEKVREMIPEMLQEQCKIGSNRRLIIIGSGDNAKHLGRLNDELGLFDWVEILEHPRYIMQYKSKDLETYLEKYVGVFKKAVGV
ncbi:uracil-DNA glycosylase family protein [Sphingorhabdus sp. YGSMI21]|uniref:uracil-DNA glycosylase family protein n=1 Tax=Sphingorhabdus sp. YGSMI21 TaxID=2077182 RepID=UPI000C1DCCD3|nr:uracil-DNA glycosylase family protein [Sphingorhabdus sp. YGSMI21]ATW04432.1 hypothetical protein CHN51_13485 [Sphingorhabdus sp. YGSMI21]